MKSLFFKNMKVTLISRTEAAEPQCFCGPSRQKSTQLPLIVGVAAPQLRPGKANPQQQKSTEITARKN